MATVADPPADPQDPPADPPAPSDPPADPKASDPPAEPELKDTDWRSEMAGEDPDLLKFLGRYHSRDAALKGFRDTYGQLRAGKFIKPLGDDPSEEEIAAYRKHMGVPEKPEGYLESLSDGLVVGDDDKPYVDKFLNAMHEAHAPPALTNAALQTYYKIVEEQSAEAAEAEKEAKQASEDALRDEWQGDYRRNVNIVDSYLEGLPKDVSEALTQGFGPDGVSLANNAGVIKWLASLALEANPVATVVPGAGANQIGAVEDEIARIEKVMRTNRAEYNRDTRMQERLRELYTAREKLKS